MTDINDLTREQRDGYEQYMRNQERIDAEFSGSWIVINRAQEYRMQSKGEMQRFIYHYGFSCIKSNWDKHESPKNKA